MEQSKKIGWVSVLFVLMFFLHPGIVAASDSTPLPYPGNGVVGLSKYKMSETPDNPNLIDPNLLNLLFLGLTRSNINHCWVTTTVEGDQGVIHSEGATGSVNFQKWSDFLETCEEGSIRLFRPNKKAIGYAELEANDIDLSCYPRFFRNLVARRLGGFMVYTWIQEMLAYAEPPPTPYDFFFMPGDNMLYCTELLAQGWINTGFSFELFPSKPACELPGWRDTVFVGEIIGMTTYGELALSTINQLIYQRLPDIEVAFTEATPVYDLADIPNNVYFEEISVD